ncbi:MAG: hypothetical protein MJY79_04420 [Bacteroidaceae bacterium]|nr:hypothetical protein [Bacteroidaceae bacterium]
MDVKIVMPEGWSVRKETVPGMGGSQEILIEAVSADGSQSVDITVGEMPAENTAADQAMTNFLDMVGFDEDDAEDYNPIEVWSFNNRKAYGFDAWLEDETPIRVMCSEAKRGVLCVLSMNAPDSEALASLQNLVERSLRIQ